MRALSELRDLHKGERAVVIGNGPSRNELRQGAGGIVFVVNDGVCAGANYRVIVDRPTLMRLDGGDRFRATVYNNGTPMFAAHNATHWEDALREDGIDLGWMNDGIIFETMTRHPRQEPWDVFEHDGIVWSYNGSPFAACGIAAWMGCNPIGVIGVDMQGPAFSEKLREDVDFNYSRLRTLLGKEGIELVSLSERNCTISLPRVVW